MFSREADMTSVALRWMLRAGLRVRCEFVTPWGMCDLVGVELDPTRVAQRMHLRQTRAIGSITRALLLLQIPDVESNKTTSLDRLAKEWTPSVPAEVIQKETDRLIADRFVVRTSSGRLQKINGWAPLHKRLLAVELKMTRIEEAMQQALNNLGFANESYVGLPSDVADRVARCPGRWSKYIDAGVGVLAVARRGIRVSVRAQMTSAACDPALQLYCVDKFWRARLRDN
jgi:hypothetical protein